VRELFLVFFGISSGLLVSAGVFAFIAAIGIVPRMAWRTKTRHFIRFYEDMIVLGGVWGTTAMFVDYRLLHWNWAILAVSLLEGVFVGVLAMALTEVLNVMPILMRRTRLTRGLRWIIPAFALGKVAGSLIYYLIDGFYVL
jgi:stage V sporulation protein AB